MREYDVQVQAKAYIYGTVRVCAENEEQARELAVVAAQSPDAPEFEVDWDTATEYSAEYWWDLENDPVSYREEMEGEYHE